MSSYRIKLWNYSLFQIPLICFELCLIAAALFWLLGFGRPRVTVAIALDLSASTYNSQAELFNRPGTVLSQKIEAVQDYLKQNNEEILRPKYKLILWWWGKKHWLQGEGSTEINAIVPMPNAFAEISVGEGVISNGYAALMKLSYFSDPRTEFIERYSQSDMDEVRSVEPPFNFTYLVGTKNGESKFELGQLREAIA